MTFGTGDMDGVLSELRDVQHGNWIQRLRNSYESFFRCDGYSAADFPLTLQDVLQHIVTFDRLVRFLRVVSKLLSLLQLEGD